MRVIHLVRKPLSEGTVAKNVLKHGTGGLNIKATRISDGGRWPANTILQHRPGCSPVGTKRVKNPSGKASGPTKSSWGTTGIYGQAFGERDRVPFYGDGDGTETVEAWECEPGCPVADLDGESGTLRARGNVNPSVSGGGTGHSWSTVSKDADHGPGDAGGASRFYKQVSSTVESD